MTAGGKLALRLAVIAWLALYVPIYAQAYGGWHFLQLCDLGVLLACLGALAGSRLLLSTQALGPPGIAVLWLADIAWRSVSGQDLNGGTAYLSDPAIPMAARLLSLFHLVLPVLLLLYVRGAGYDPRALPLQAAIAAAAIAVSWFRIPAGDNLNYVRAWPDGGIVLRQIPAAHALASWLLLCAVIYLPTHLLFLRLFGKTRPAP